MNRMTHIPYLLNPLSTYILHSGIRLTLLMLLISRILTYRIGSVSMLNTVLISCRRIYPLLTLMVLTITVVGALLIDIYDKTQNTSC